MNNPPTLWRILSSLWLQNFRVRPFATVASTVLFTVVLAALLFAGAFFFIGFIVIAIVLAVVQRFFLGAPKWQQSEQQKQSPKHSTHTVHEESHSSTTIEGDYSVISDQASSKKSNTEQSGES